MSVIDCISGGRRAPQSRRARGPATLPFTVGEYESRSVEGPPQAKQAAEIVAPAVSDSSDLAATPERDAIGQRLGAALLTELAALQRDLLIKENYTAILERLNAQLTATAPTVSPDLEAVLSAVRLRARVELARRGQ
jgi:hypothetical protein